MDSKTKELLETIKFPEDDFSSFFHTTLKKVKVSNDKMHIILSNDVPYKLVVYERLHQALKDFFQTEFLLEVKTEK